MDALDYPALAEFRYQIRRFLHFSEQVAREAGVEPQQHQLLLALKGLPAGARPTVAEIAERLQVRHHSAVGLIDRAVRRGLIQRIRQQNPDDLREVFLELTADGEQLLHALSQLHRTELRSRAPALIRTLGTLMSPPSSHVTSQGRS